MAKSSAKVYIISWPSKGWYVCKLKCMLKWMLLRATSYSRWMNVVHRAVETIGRDIRGTAQLWYMQKWGMTLAAILKGEQDQAMASVAIPDKWCACVGWNDENMQGNEWPKWKATIKEECGFIPHVHGVFWSVQHSCQFPWTSQTYTVKSFTELGPHRLKGRNATYLPSESFPKIC